MEDINVFNKNFKIEKIYPPTGQKKVYKVFNEGQSYILKIVTFNEIQELERTYREAEFLKNNNQDSHFPKILNMELYFFEKQFCILEEYIEGISLEEKKSEYKNKEKKVIELLEELVIGMSQLWSKNIVHRDLKPSNIIIRSNETPVILDLGIAKFLEYSPITRTEQMPYSNYYFSPEQFKNLNHLITERTDFFVLGIVAYELYTGKHPFDKDSTKLLKGEYPETDNERFNALMKKLLKVQPYERFRTDSDFKNYLKDYLNKL